jgi:hypothetical protein
MMKAQFVIDGVNRDKEDLTGADVIDGLLWFPFNLIAKDANYRDALEAGNQRIARLTELEKEKNCRTVAAEPPVPRTTALPAVAATSPSSRIAMPRPGAKKGRTFSARQLTLLFSGSTVTATEYGATCIGKYETERTFKISPDGTFSVSTQCEGYSGQWLILDDDSGTWRVAGDWVCMAFRSRRDDDDECWAVKNTRQGFVALGPGGGVEWHLAISNPRYSSKEALLAALNAAKAGTP